MPAAAVTASSSSGSSSSERSCISAATCSPFRSMSVVARPRASARKIERPALDVGVGLELRQPVGELERGVAQRAGQRVAQVGRAQIAAELDDELAERRVREPAVEETDQEDGRSERERCERRPPDLGDPGTTVRGRAEEKRDHQETAREGVHEQPKRAAKRPDGTEPADDEHRHAQQTVRGHQRELNLAQRFRHAEVDLALDQVVRAEPAEVHAQKLEADRRRIRQHDQPAHEPSPQPPIRKGEEDVQEDDRGDEVERLPEREKEIVLADQTSVARKFVKPAAIIKGPKRLVGRRDQATRPQTM